MSLTADELTTLAETLGHEPPVALVELIEGWLADHRDEAVVMADLAHCGCPHGLGYQFHRFPCVHAGRIDPSA